MGKQIKKSVYVCCLIAGIIILGFAILTNIEYITNIFIEKVSGLTLKRLDINTNPIFILNYQGKALLEDRNSIAVKLNSIYWLKKERVVLLAQYSGGTACPVTYHLISLYDGKAQLSREFGNCAEIKSTKKFDNKLSFTFYADYGKRLNVLYKNHQLIEEQVNLPLKDTGESNNLDYLKKYAVNNDVESLLQDKWLSAELIKILGDNWDKFKQRLDLSKAEISNNFIIISGMMAHSGGQEEAFMMISLKSREIYAVVLETNYTAKSSMQTIKAYTNQSINYSNIPLEMQDWLAKFKDAKIFGNTAVINNFY